MTTTTTERGTRPIRREAATHRFAVGQTVRLKGGPGTSHYRITATLPPRGNSLQYRIRNEEERYERVTTEDSIELVDTAAAGASLIAKTFGDGQGAKALQPLDAKAQPGEGESPTET